MTWHMKWREYEKKKVEVRWGSIVTICFILCPSKLAQNASKTPIVFKTHSLISSMFKHVQAIFTHPGNAHSRPATRNARQLRQLGDGMIKSWVWLIESLLFDKFQCVYTQNCCGWTADQGSLPMFGHNLDQLEIAAPETVVFLTNHRT